ncbi:hypothetical protein M0R45_006975 [Rubus argutus]|uniref:Uncharacterized protein n=1 Tax=Rubus argutus TaxID=59490 RepID=A0AAW1YSJ2_RUBAR
MVRERKDFYQLKKAAGEDPVPEVAAADATDAAVPAPVAAPSAAVDSAPKRKKKKAKRARSASEVEVDVEEDAGVQETAELAYEEQMLDRRYWKELQTASQGMQSIQTHFENLAREKGEVEAKLLRAEKEAGRKIAQSEERAEVYAREVEDKAKAVVASETARIQAEFDRRLDGELEKAKADAVLAYRRDRGRAVEQTTAFIEGGVYILGKIKEAFPGQDWSQLPVPHSHR